MTNRPQFGRSFFAPVFFLLIALAWGMWDIAKTGPLQPFKWSNLLEPSTWLQPLTLTPVDKHPKTHLIGHSVITDVMCLPDTTNCWAVSWGGLIFHTTDAGQTWQVQTSNTDEELQNIYFISPEEGWAVGSNGTILHTTDAGQRWQAQTSNTEVYLESVFFISPEEGWAVGDTGTILHTTNGGQRWHSQTSPSDKQLISIYFASPKEGWVVGSHGTILRTTDAGQHWQAQTSNTNVFLESIYFASSQEGWTVGDSGTILHTTNAGQHWQAQSSNTGEKLESVFFNSLQDGWAVGSAGTILHTTDAGQHWHAQSSNTGAKLESVYFNSHQVGWAVGWNGTILHSTNAGQHWQAQTSSPNLFLESVYFNSLQNGWAVGSAGTILHTTDAGQRWHVQTSNTDEYLNSVYFASSQVGWAVGINGTILHTTDAGQHWQAQTSNTDEYLYSVYFTSPQEGWAAGGNGTILHTTNAGQHWQVQTSNTDEHLCSVYFTSPQEGWAVGINGTILHTTDAGQNWQAQTSNTYEDLISVYFTSPQVGWAVGDNGTILHTTNAGQNWQAQTSNADEYLSSVFFTSPQAGWAVGSNRTILHTSDAGQNWQAQTSNADEYLTSVFFTSPQVGWAVGYFGAILHTTDAGQNWTRIFNPDQSFYEQLRDKRFGNYHHWPSPLALVLLALGGIWLFTSLRTMSNNPAAYLSNDHGGLADAPVQFADQDRLGYAPLARGIAKLIRNLDSKPPLAIAVSAPWGHGKSSVINMLREALATDARTVHFNAWHYRDDSQILAALIEHIRDQAIPASLSMANLMFRLRLLWRRVLQPSWRWWALVVPVCALTLWYYGQRFDLDWGKALAQLREQSHGWAEPILQLATNLPEGIPQLLAVLLLFLLGPKTLSKIAGPLKSFTAGEPVAALSSPLSTLNNYLQTTRKNWQDDAGLRFQFQRDFGDICYALGRDRLVILIDDLDRCDPDHIEQIISTLNFLFSNQNPCYVVMALDWNYVKTALGVAYENMADALKAYEDPNANERENQQAFAERYLRKIIQLKVELPERNVVLAFAEEATQQQADPASINYLTFFSRCLKIATQITGDTLEAIKHLPEKLREKKESKESITGENKTISETLWTVVRLGFWPFKFTLTLVEILIWLPVYKILYRFKASDAERLMNAIFVGVFSFILASLVTIAVVSMVPEQQRKPDPITSQIVQPLSAPSAGRQESGNKGEPGQEEQKKNSAPVIVLEPQKNTTEDLLPLIILLFSFPIIFWMAWFIRQERDSSSFSLALKDWKQQLADQIKTPREWRRLENNLRFFIMLARSFDYVNPWDKLNRALKEIKNRIAAFSNNQPYEAPRKFKLDEGIATRLLMADIHFNGQIYALLKDGLEQRTFEGTLGRAWMLESPCHKIDPHLTAFFERLVDENDTEATEQIRMWLRLHSFKLQLPMNAKAKDINSTE